MKTLEFNVLLEWGRRLYAWCWGLAVFILVLLALYASLGRYYIAYLDQFQQELVSRIELQTGLEVELTSLNGQWSGLSPVIKLHELQISSGDQVAISLQDAKIKLNVLGGLFSRQLFIRNITTRGLRLHFYQREQGDWSFAGIVLGQGNRRADNLFDSLLALREVKLRDSRAFLHYQSQNPAEFWSGRLDLEGDGFFRRLNTSFGVDQSKPAKLIVEASGDPRDSQFQANAFVRLDDSRFETLAPLFGELSELADGKANGDLWLQWRSGGETTFQAQLDIPQLAIGAFWKRPSQQVKNIDVQLGGVLREGRWQFRVPRLRGEWHQKAVQFEGIRIRQIGAEAELLQVSLPSLDLNEARGLLHNTGLVPKRLNDILEELSPAGELRNVRVAVPLRPDESHKFTVESEFHQLAVNPWGGVPGVTDATGYVQLQGGKGSVLLDSEQLKLFFPGLYARPFQVQNFQGALDWQVNDNAVQIISGPMHFTDQGAQLGAILALQIPDSASEEAPSMTLSIGLKDGRAQAHKKYIPQTLPEGLRDWLDGSILSGQIDTGAFVYRGSLRPDDQQDRTVQLFFDVQSANLDYHPDWPELQNIRALVEIDDGITTATAQEATLYSGSRLQSADVKVLPVNGETRLLVDAQLALPLPEALQVITHTPVREQLGSAFDQWRADGQASAKVQLDIPLVKQGRPAAVAVEASIDSGSLYLDQYGLAFHHLQGPLQFDSTAGLSSKGLEARFYDKPMSVRISQGQGQPVLVDIDTEVSAEVLRDWLKQPVLGFAEGQSAFQVQIEVGSEVAELRAQSQLRGLGINLPAPLYKAVAEKRNLSLKLPLGVSEPLLSLSLEDMGTLRLRLGEEGAFAGAVMSLGEVDPLELQAGVFQIHGQLPVAALTPWQAALDHYLSLTTEYAEVLGGDTQAVPVRVRDLFVQGILAFDRHFETVTLNASNGEQGQSPWTIRISNPMLTGSLLIPEAGSDAVLQARLQSLYLPAFAEGDTAEAQSPQTSLLAAIDPRELLDVDVDIEHLYFGEEDWGSLGFNLRANTTGAHFKSLRGHLRGIAIDGQGEEVVLHWLRDPAGDRSHFQGALFIDQIGDVMEKWQVPRMMESESGRMDVDLRWPGPPDLVSALSMDGDIAMRFDKGRLLEAPDLASGTLRMVAIFNFANVLRRLQLDFRDVFRKGIHYDKIDGNMHFENGIMSMNTPLVVEGPSTRFRMTGDLNFHTDQTDMELVATLPVRSNLPWIAALVSGLPAAAGVYIASKLFEEQMEKYSSAVYSVSGPWQNPELKFRRIFDDKRSLPGKPANTAEQGDTASPADSGAASVPGEASGQSTVDMPDEQPEVEEAP